MNEKYSSFTKSTIFNRLFSVKNDIYLSNNGLFLYGRFLTDLKFYRAVRKKCFSRYHWKYPEPIAIAYQVLIIYISYTHTPSILSNWKVNLWIIQLFQLLKTKSTCCHNEGWYCCTHTIYMIKRWHNKYNDEHYYINKDCNRWTFQVNEWKTVNLLTS